MSKRRRKPGRFFWLWAFAVGVYSPNKGQRRVAADRAADKMHIAKLEAENATLKSRLEYVLGQKLDSDAREQTIRATMEMDDGIRAMDKVKATVHKVSATIPLRAPSWATTDPSVINNGVQKTDSQAAS